MKLITWNVQWGLGADRRLDLSRIVGEAKAIADFDVLCLQEIASGMSDLEGLQGEDEFAAFAALLPGYAAVEGVAVDLPGEGGRRRRFGNLLLSRLPVGPVLAYTLPWEAAATRNMPRNLLDVLIEAPFGPVRVMTTHLEWSSSTLRAAQVEAIREAHRTACARHAKPRETGTGPYAPAPTAASAILTGDFNMRPDDPIKRRLGDAIGAGVPALRDAWEAIHPGEPHPVSFCLYDRTAGEPHCCDYILVSEDLVPRLSRIHYDERSQASDHQPVLVELER
jgi:endonuclease/exonuclease/phosphatase family metal-dependent hydrolase